MKITDKHGQIWQLVPVEPDEIMLDKAIKVDLAKDVDEKSICLNLYQTMIAASPEPELPEGLEPVANLYLDMNSGGKAGCLKVCYITPCDDAFPVVRQSTALKVLALKAEILEQCRIIGMGAERELALNAKIERQDKLIEQCRQKLFSASICHPNGVLNLVEEALAAIEKVIGE